MLPLIVIGATDRVTEILTPFAEVGHISYHPTAEAAHHALLDGTQRLRVGEFERDGIPNRAPVAEIELDYRKNVSMAPSGHWRVHVAYGPKAYGELCRASVRSTVSPTLMHGGHTLIFGLDIHDPKLAIRALGGEPTEEPDNTMIWQAAVTARADLVLDLEREDAVRHLVGYLDWKSVTA